MTRSVIGPQSKRPALIVSHSWLVKSTGDIGDTFNFLLSEIPFWIISNVLTERKAQVLNGKVFRGKNGHPVSLSCYKIALMLERPRKLTKCFPNYGYLFDFLNFF